MSVQCSRITFFHKKYEEANAHSSTQWILPHRFFWTQNAEANGVKRPETI
jgi:hypothetical protein